MPQALPGHCQRRQKSSDGMSGGARLSPMGDTEPRPGRRTLAIARLNSKTEEERLEPGTFRSAVFKFAFVCLSASLVVSALRIFRDLARESAQDVSEGLSRLASRFASF